MVLPAAYCLSLLRGETWTCVITSKVIGALGAKRMKNITSQSSEITRDSELVITQIGFWPNG
jgi:hypothetical protein